MRKLFKVSLVFALFFVFTFATASHEASAGLIFDRGLPTTNLNKAAGANRSNVAWADNESTSSPTDYWLPGDDFKITGSGLYHVDTIRVWSTDSTGLSLWLGSVGGTISNIGAPSSVTPVTYTNGEGYQGNSGAFRPIYQVDFTLNQNVTAGTTYQVFLDGPWKLYNPDNSSLGYVNAFLHASNTAFSGSPQEGADDTFLWLRRNGAGNVGVETWFSGPGGGTSGFPSGGFPNSDGNVQVYGAPVPIPGAIWLLGSV